MTSSRSAAPPSSGQQQPRIFSFPDFDRSLGPEFIEVAEIAGLIPDDWQRFVVENSLGIRPSGMLATPEVAEVIPRQNGKGGVLEIFELGRLFVLGSPLTIHSAHLYKTSTEAFMRIEALIRNTPELHEQVKRYSHTNGDEGIELHTGARLQFVARTKGGGRGLSAECLILDEAMYLPDTVMAALVPTGSAKEYRQIIYAGSAVDQMTMPDGLTLARVRERGIAGDDQLAYFEWSVDCATPDDVTEEMAEDRALWAQSNPAFGIRISEASIELDKRVLTPRGFAVERLNVGDWPALDGSDSIISLEKWGALADRGSKIDGPLCFVVDVSPSRSHASIGVAGVRKDGLKHVETVEQGRGTAWIPAKLRSLQDRQAPFAIYCAANSPAESLVPDIQKAGVEIETVSVSEHAQACGRFFDAVEQATLRHLGGPELAAALKGAAKRPLDEAWAWSRKNSSVDITPLVACTIAHWAVAKHVEGEIMVAWG